MAKLLKEHEQLEARRIKTKEQAEKMDEDANDVRHRAAVAGTKRVKAHEEMMRKKAHAQRRAQKANQARQRAHHAKHAVHYAAKAIEAWKEAAEGKPCEGGDDEDSEEEASDDDHDRPDGDGDGDDDDDGPNTGMIVGLAVGIGAVLLLIIGAACFLVGRRSGYRRQNA
mmetsp:Transcript_27584/g.64310  ORF Transcript_27584/g.64310 Transcript_27584/m.64310 type:complete len:169 (+) Transcript_27584:1-507(+)